MARISLKTKVKLPDLKDYITKVKQVTAEEATRTVMFDLKRAGPYFTGEFEKAWVSRAGDVPIPTARASKYTEEERFEIARTKQKVFTEPVVIPLKGKELNSYTIGNLMDYRDIAMDLVDPPERVGRLSAERDWYVLYVQGTDLITSLRRGVQQATRDPRLK